MEDSCRETVATNSRSHVFYHRRRRRRHYRVHGTDSLRSFEIDLLSDIYLSIDRSYIVYRICRIVMLRRSIDHDEDDA
jgi:hypothetical protein